MNNYSVASMINPHGLTLQVKRNGCTFETTSAMQEGVWRFFTHVALRQKEIRECNK